MPFTLHQLLDPSFPVEALSPANRRLFFILSAQAQDPRYPSAEDNYIDGDYDLVGSNRRFELGE